MSGDNKAIEQAEKLQQEYNQLRGEYLGDMKYFNLVLGYADSGLVDLKGRTKEQLLELRDFVEEQCRAFVNMNDTVNINEKVDNKKSINESELKEVKNKLEDLKSKKDSFKYEDKEKNVSKQLRISEALSDRHFKKTSSKLFPNSQIANKVKKLLSDIRRALKDDYENLIGIRKGKIKPELTESEKKNLSEKIKGILDELNNHYDVNEEKYLHPNIKTVREIIIEVLKEEHDELNPNHPYSFEKNDYLENKSKKAKKTSTIKSLFKDRRAGYVELETVEHANKVNLGSSTNSDMKKGKYKSNSMTARVIKSLKSFGVKNRRLNKNGFQRL